MRRFAPISILALAACTSGSQTAATKADNVDRLLALVPDAGMVALDAGNQDAAEELVADAQVTNDNTTHEDTDNGDDPTEPGCVKEYNDPIRCFPTADGVYRDKCDMMGNLTEYAAFKDADLKMICAKNACCIYFGSFKHNCDTYCDKEYCPIGGSGKCRTSPAAIPGCLGWTADYCDCTCKT